MSEKTPVFVLYHANCYDGFGAAFAAWMALEDDAEYIPVTYGQPMPDIPDGAIVAIVDFSYPREELLELSDRVSELVVLDHHQTAQEDLEGLDFAIFDLDKSGAILAWEYWHPYKPVPKLLRYIEDRDLWRFHLTGSREVNAALRMYDFDFEVWDDFMIFPEMTIGDMERAGRVLLRFTNQQVGNMCDQAFEMVIAEYTVPVVNATAFWSEVATELLDRNPDAPFAAAYFDRADGKRQWSLRSRSDFSVNRIAQEFGGGGHPQAAGFTTDRDGWGFRYDW